MCAVRRLVRDPARQVAAGLALSDVPRPARRGARVGDKALVCPHCGRWLHGKSRSGTGRPADRSRENQIGPGCIVAVIIAVFFFFVVISRM